MTDNKFIERRRPACREDLSVDDLTDLVTYLYAELGQGVALLQYQLAYLTGRCLAIFTVACSLGAFTDA